MKGKAMCYPCVRCNKCGNMIDLCFDDIVANPNNKKADTNKKVSKTSTSRAIGEDSNILLKAPALN